MTTSSWPSTGAVSRCWRCSSPTRSASTRDAQREIGLAGALHDVGKREIDPVILEKRGPLDDVEWEQIHRHPALGEQILRDLGLTGIAGWVRWHHERPDGAAIRTVWPRRRFRSRPQSWPSPTRSTRCSPTAATEGSSARARLCLSSGVAPGPNSTVRSLRPPYDVVSMYPMERMRVYPAPADVASYLGEAA